MKVLHAVDVGLPVHRSEKEDNVLEGMLAGGDTILREIDACWRHRNSSRIDHCPP